MTSLTIVRRIAARPSIVFDAIVEPQGIAAWWGPDEGPVLVAESDIRVGGGFRVRFRTSDGNEHESRGEYLELVRPSRLVMSWRWTSGGEPDEVNAESRLEFELRAIDAGTELTLTHARLQTEISRAHHQSGWEGALNKLERHFMTLAV